MNIMKTKIIYLTLVFLFSGAYTHAQLMDKLKLRAKEKGLETKEVSFDTTDNEKYRTTSYEVEELALNTPQDFYNKDVVMLGYNEKGGLTQTSYFDSETVAMRTELVEDPSKLPIFHDDKGNMYAYSEDDGQYAVMNILPPALMGFMVGGITVSTYKLPQEPYYEALEALEKVGSGLNFMIMELAFMYKPMHFQNDANYTPQKISCGGSDCIRFNYTHPDYIGSYIQFDAQGKLREFNLDIVYSEENSNDSKTSSGKFLFSYKPVTVKLPDAVEQSMIPGPMGKIFNLEKGLEPWKHNEKDEQKKKDNNN